MNSLVSETLGLSDSEYEGHLADRLQDEGCEAVKELIALIEKEVELLALENSDFLAAPTHHLPFLPEQGGFRDSVIAVCMQDRNPDEKRNVLTEILKDLRTTLLQKKKRAEEALNITNLLWRPRARALACLDTQGFISDGPGYTLRRKHYPQGMHRPQPNPRGYRTPLHAALDALRQVPEHRECVLRRLQEIEGEAPEYRGDLVFQSKFGGYALGNMGGTFNADKEGGLFRDLAGMEDHPGIPTSLDPQRVRTLLNPEFATSTASIARTLTPVELWAGRDETGRGSVFSELAFEDQQELRNAVDSDRPPVLQYSIPDVRGKSHPLELGQFHSVRHVSPLAWVALGDPADPRKASIEVTFDQFLLRFGQIHAGVRSAKPLTNRF